MKGIAPVHPHVDGHGAWSPWHGWDVKHMAFSSEEKRRLVDKCNFFCIGDQAPVSLHQARGLFAKPR